MLLRDYTKETGEKVIKVVFRHFGTPIDTLYSKRGDNASYKARMYVYLILHIDYNISINQISMLMKKTPRNINRCIAKLKHQIEYYDDIRENYQIIMELLKEKDSYDKTNDNCII